MSNKEFEYQLNLPSGTDFAKKMTDLIDKLEKINSNKLNIKIDLSAYMTAIEIVRDFQKKLISGENIKTINDQKILGSGNIKIDSVNPSVIGNLSDLSTSTKINIVSAINEVNRIINEIKNNKDDINYIDNKVAEINSKIASLMTQVNNTLSSLNALQNELGGLNGRINIIENAYVKNVTYAENTGIFTFTMQDGTTRKFDLAIEKVVANFEYDSATSSLVLTLADGTKQTVPLTALVGDFSGVDGDVIKIDVSGDNSISAELKGKTIGETYLTDAIMTKINQGVKGYQKVVNIENEYVKSISEENGIITVKLQDGTTKTIEVSPGKGVQNFEYIEGGEITDLTNLTVTVPAGWTAPAGYGIFTIASTIQAFDSDGNEVMFNQQDDMFGIGYDLSALNGDNYNPVENSIILREPMHLGGVFDDIKDEPITNEYSMIIYFEDVRNLGGDQDYYEYCDYDNPQLIQWLKDNNATFEGASTGPIIRLTLIDGTVFEVPVPKSSESVVIDAYTKEEANNLFSTKEQLTATNTSVSRIDNRVTVIENSYIKSVTYDNKTGIFVFTLQDGSVQNFDLAVEKIVSNFSYNAETQNLELVLADGSKQLVPVTDLIQEYKGVENSCIQTVVNSSNKIEAILKDKSIGFEKLTDDVKNVVLESNIFIAEEKTIEVSKWDVFDDIEPYDYKAIVSLENLTTNTTSIELVNNQVILFAKHGFVIANINGSDVTVYSVGMPEEDVKLTFEMHEKVSIWDGSYTEE